LKYPERINKIIPRVLKNMNIEIKLKNCQVISKWKVIVGERIAQHSLAVAADDEVLYVEVDNSVWESQLFIMKNQIIEKIRKSGFEIKDIKFRLKDFLPPNQIRRKL